MTSTPSHLFNAKFREITRTAAQDSTGGNTWSETTSGLRDCRFHYKAGSESEMGRVTTQHEARIYCDPDDAPALNSLVSIDGDDRKFRVVESGDMHVENVLARVLLRLER